MFASTSRREVFFKRILSVSFYRHEKVKFSVVNWQPMVPFPVISTEHVKNS